MKHVIIGIVLASCAFAAQRVTDAEERYRIKYGRYPRHVEERERELLDAMKKRSEPLFRQLDANRDGKVTEREAAAWHRRTFSARKSSAVWLSRFNAADTDQDGIVTAQEWRTRGEQAGQ